MIDDALTLVIIRKILGASNSKFKLRRGRGPACGFAAGMWLAISRLKLKLRRPRRKVTEFHATRASIQRKRDRDRDRQRGAILCVEFSCANEHLKSTL